MTDKATDTRIPYFLIEESVIDDYELDPYEGWLYIVLVKHANRKTGESFPGLTRLAKLARMSRSQVIRSIESLEEKKLIRVERDELPVKGEKRQRSVNHYFVLHAANGYEKSSSSVPQTLGVVSGRDYPSAPETLGVVSQVDRNNVIQDSEDKKKNPPKLKAKTKRQILIEQLTPYSGIAHTILTLIEQGYSGEMNTPETYMTIPHMEKYLPQLEELARMGATSEELKCLHAHFKPIYDDGKWTIGVKTFVEKLQPYRTIKAKQPAARPAPIIPDKPPATPEERAALVAAVADIRPEWETKDKVSA